MVRRRALIQTSVVALSVALAVASSGCASDEPDAQPEATVQPEATTVQPEAKPPTVALEDHSAATGGKVLHFTASTGEQLYRAGGLYGIELRGTDLERPQLPTNSGLGNLAARRCDAAPCEWTVVPEAASTFEFRAFLIDLKTGSSTAESLPVRAVWTAPPRPHAFKFLVNGKSKPTTALNAGDTYLDVPAGKVQIEARWTTDARDTGYYVEISMSEPRKQVYASCSTGTSCAVPTKVPIRVDQEISWQVKVLTMRDDKLVAGFQVCLIGRT